MKTLYSPVPAQRAAAIADLWSDLCHQETVYEASAVAVPLLFEAAREAPLPSSERDQLLGLVACIGRGEDTCWEGYTSWEVVQDCAAAVEAVLPELVEWAAEGNAEACKWAIVLATYFPAKWRALGQDATTFLTEPDPMLARLVRLLVDEVEPEASLVQDVAARDEDTLDWLQNGLTSIR